jgi:hypothetical protein
MVAPQICFYIFTHAFLEFYCILTSVCLFYICIIESMTVRGFMLVQIDCLCIFTVKIFLLACYVQLWQKCSGYIPNNCGSFILFFPYASDISLQLLTVVGSNSANFVG